VKTLLGTERGRQGIPCSSVGLRKDDTTPQEDKMSQEAKATSRKATGIHNRVDRAGKPEIPTSKEGRRGTGAPLNETMKARKWRCKIDALYECNRSLLKPCRRSQRTMDLRAVCGESRTHGSKGGRVPRGTDLSQLWAGWRPATVDATVRPGGCGPHESLQWWRRQYRSHRRTS
jgi:hypothetical protein